MTRGLLLDFDPAAAGSDVDALLESFDHTCPAYNRSSIAFMQAVHARGCPIFRTEALGGFHVVSAYHLIEEVARRPDIFSNEAGITIPPTSIGRTLPIDLDPPRSLLYRGLLAPWLSPAAVKARSAEVHQLARELVAACGRDGTLDVTVDLAQPLTGRITMRMLGLPEEEWAAYAAPVHDATFGNGSPQELYAGIVAFNMAIARDVADPSRGAPGGALAELRRARIEDRPLAAEEVEAMVRLILIGGLDTAQAAIGTSVVHLFQNPDQREALVRDPRLMAGAVSELLRVLAPQQMLCRTVRQDYELGGQRLRSGDRVMLLWAAANFDPSAFEAPTRIDFGRRSGRHLTFGLGAHRCAGAYLAELEIAAALSALLEAGPGYVVETEKLALAPLVGVVYGFNNVPVRLR